MLLVERKPGGKSRMRQRLRQCERWAFAVVHLSGIQDSSDRTVVDPHGGRNTVQRVTALVGDEDRLNRLHRLPGHLGGHQLGGKLRSCVVCVTGRVHTRANCVRARHHTL